METSRKEHGVVKGIREHYDDKSCCEVEVETTLRHYGKKANRLGVGEERTA